MKKNTVKALAALFLASFAFWVTACKTDVADTTPPAKVTDVNATAANGKAVITWTNPADEDFYATRITVAPKVENGNSSLVIEGSANDKSSASFDGLVNGTEYTFKLYSLDNSHNVSEAVEVTAKPEKSDDSTAPAEVTNLSVSCVNGANGKVNAILIWTDPDDDDLFGMEVTYAEDSNSRAAVAPMADGSIFVAPGKGGAVINDLTAGTTYTFTVKAMDTNGNKSDGVSTTETMTLSQLSELKITLTPSTTEITNEDVTVTVKAESSSTVSKIYYVSGIKTSVADVLKGTEITTASSFTATENGTYTIAALDYDGRRELSYITIENIDKTAPKAPTNLAASYDYGKKTITLTWNTSDSDVDHYLVSYTKAGTDVVTDENVTEKSYTVSNVEVGTTEEEYEFTVKVVDKAENTGSEATASITPKAAPLVSKIELERSHFTYKEAGTTFTATVYGSNFDLISSQTDTSVKVQIVDSSNSVTTFDAVIDAENNNATATLTLPTLSSASTAGTNYTVRAKVCGTADKEHTTTFNISDVAKVSGVKLETTQISVNDVTSGMMTKATVEGTNFDVAGTIALALYDSTGNKYGDSVTVDSTEFTQSTTSFDVELSVPTLDDTYTVKVLFAEVAQSTTASLQVYGVPAFTSFKIPNAGTIYEDRTVTATVIGKNFAAPGVTESDFSVTCDTSSITADSVITIVSDTELTVSLTIPGTAGSYDVTIKNGNNSTTGTFTVKDTTGYSVGDIILADGTNVAVATYQSSDTNKPVAVVAGFNANGAVIGLGLKKSNSSLMWAKSNTTGYNTKFTDIIAKYSGNSSSGYTFTGDCDGSDNWEYICSVDPEGSANASENYPAFNFANTYGTTQGYTDDLATGWYIPSISELYEIYKNKETLQTSLTKVGGFTIDTSYYWSSSQSSFDYCYAYKLYFSNGYVYYYNYKDVKYTVLVVRAF